MRIFINILIMILAGKFKNKMNLTKEIRNYEMVEIMK